MIRYHLPFLAVLALLTTVAVAAPIKIKKEDRKAVNEAVQTKGGDDADF